jgi:RNA polymerase sigma-70 factor (ECF subfamily)
MESEEEPVEIIRLFSKSGTVRKRIVDSRERLFRVAYSWCHDRYQADDLCQETIITALEKVDQLRAEDALDAWMFRIMQNAYRKHFRKMKPQVDVESLEDHMEEEAPAERDIERAEEILQVRAGLAQLKESQRMIISLVDIEGVSYKEAADILEIPIGTVMSRLARARDALSRHIQQDAGQHQQKRKRSHLKVMK